MAVVSGICVEHDAISAAAASQALEVTRHPRVERVDLFAGAIDRPVDVASHTVEDPWQLLRHPRFREADIAVFHWGIRYPMFEALTLMGATGPKPVILFHNVTPERLVEESQRPVIAASIAQLAHALSLGTPVWTFSEENRRTLIGFGVTNDRIRFVPFAIVPSLPAS